VLVIEAAKSSFFSGFFERLGAKQLGAGAADHAVRRRALRDAEVWGG
jgi:hypothetical protein